MHSHFFAHELLEVNKLYYRSRLVNVLIMDLFRFYVQQDQINELIYFEKSTRRYIAHDMSMNNVCLNTLYRTFLQETHNNRYNIYIFGQSMKL